MIIPEVEHLGPLDRCPLATLRDLSPNTAWWVDTLIHLATAHRSGSLGVYLGRPSERTERLLQTALNDIERIRTELFKG